MKADELLEEMVREFEDHFYLSRKESLRAALRVFMEKTGMGHQTLTGLALVHNLMDDGKHEVTCAQMRRVIEAHELLLTLTDTEGTE